MAYSSINQKSLDRCKQFVSGAAWRGVRGEEQGSVEDRVGKMLGAALTGAEYMHTKQAGARGAGWIREASVFISKHISTLIEYPALHHPTTSKPWRLG